MHPRLQRHGPHQIVRAQQGGGGAVHRHPPAGIVQVAQHQQRVGGRRGNDLHAIGLVPPDLRKRFRAGRRRQRHAGILLQQRRLLVVDMRQRPQQRLRIRLHVDRVHQPGSRPGIGQRVHPDPLVTVDPHLQPLDRRHHVVGRLHEVLQVQHPQRRRDVQDVVGGALPRDLIRPPLQHPEGVAEAGGHVRLHPLQRGEPVRHPLAGGELEIARPREAERLRPLPEPGDRLRGQAVHPRIETHQITPPKPPQVHPDHEKQQHDNHPHGHSLPRQQRREQHRPDEQPAEQQAASRLAHRGQDEVVRQASILEVQTFPGANGEHPAHELRPGLPHPRNPRRQRQPRPP